MLINDVGGRFEEINVGRAGANYGWPVADHGPTTDPAFQGPIYWYPAASIGGGAFCPAGAAPHAFGPEFRSRYFFMDFVQGWIKSLDPLSTERPVPAEVFATGLARPVDLAFDADGSLLVLLRDALGCATISSSPAPARWSASGRGSNGKASPRLPACSAI